MLLSFQRPSRPVGKGIPSKGRSPRTEVLEPKFLGAGSSSLAPLDAGCGLRVRPDVPAPLSGSIRTVRSAASCGSRREPWHGSPHAAIPCGDRLSALSGPMQGPSGPVRAAPMATGSGPQGETDAPTCPVRTSTDAARRWR
jgi:hypothetical protein